MASGVKRKRTPEQVDFDCNNIIINPKRKQTNEKETFDPIPFPLPENNNNVSCDKDKRNPISFEQNNEVNVHLPKSSEVLIKNSIYDLFQTHSKVNNSPVALLFTGPVLTDNSSTSNFCDDGCSYVEYLSNNVGSKYLNSLVAVTNSFDAEKNSYPISIIQDENAYLAKLFRTLHPIGGGRIALDCIVFLDSDLHQRGLVPLYTITNTERLLDVVNDTLQYLQWEQHQNEQR